MSLWEILTGKKKDLGKVETSGPATESSKGHGSGTVQPDAEDAKTWDTKR